MRDVIPTTSSNIFNTKYLSWYKKLYFTLVTYCTSLFVTNGKKALTLEEVREKAIRKKKDEANWYTVKSYNNMILKYVSQYKAGNEILKDKNLNFFKSYDPFNLIAHTYLTSGYIRECDPKDFKEWLLTLDKETLKKYKIKLERK